MSFNNNPHHPATRTRWVSAIEPEASDVHDLQIDDFCELRLADNRLVLIAVTGICCGGESKAVLE